MNCKVNCHMSANCSLGSTEGFSKSILLLGQVVLFECILSKTQELLPWQPLLLADIFMPYIL